MQCGRGAGSSSRRSLWDFHQAVRIDQRVLYKLRRQGDWDSFGIRGLSTIFLHGKSTNRLSPARVSTSSRSCVSLDLTRRNHLHIAFVARFRESSNRNTSRQMVLQSAPSPRRNDILRSAGSLCTHLSTPFTKSTRWVHAILFSEDVPHLSLFCQQLFKLHEGRCIHPFWPPETRDHHTAQSAHKTAATAPANGFVTRVIPISRINFLP
jgi:hypothetical protein